MARKNFSEKQMIEAVQKVQNGSTVKATCRKWGITPVTFYRWKSKFEGMNEKDAKKLKDLEDENKRVRRIYREENLSYRIAKRRRLRHKGKFYKPTAFNPNDHWSIDFVMDKTTRRRKLRMLTIIDNFTRESPGVLADHCLKSKDVARYLEILTNVK